MKKNICFLPSFYIKILAAVFMVLDHIGNFFISYGIYSSVASILIYIGRLSLPLFAFLIIEGLLHTKNIKNYLYRMSLGSLVLFIGITIVQYLYPKYNTFLDNIFLEFLLAMLTVYFFSLEGKKKLLGLIPIVYIVAMYVVVVYERANLVNLPFILYGLRPQYGIYGYLLIVGGYYLITYYKSKVKNICSSNGILFEDYQQTTNYKLKYNLMFISWLFIIIVLFDLIRYMNTSFDVYSMAIESYAMISAIFIFFYSHNLGTPKPMQKHKYFNKYFYYFFYPLHIIILFLIFMLIFK